MNLRNVIALGLVTTFVFAVGCARNPDEFEDDNKCERANPIEVGKVQTHTIHKRRDSDWTKLTVEADKKYKIRIGRSTSGKSLSLSLHEACGKPGSMASQRPNPFLMWPAKSAGEVYLSVGSTKVTTYDLEVTTYD